MENIKDISEMSESILLSVKKQIGIPQEDDSFDLDIMLNINAASSVLFQLGVLEKAYTITGDDDTYKDLLPNVSEDVINQVKMYFVYKTKLGFDSSTLSGSMIDVLERMIKETEWRLQASYNPKNTFD